MLLTDIKIRKAAPADKSYKMSDGKGLYLQVMTTGAKYWRMKYRWLGKEKKLSVGVYPDVSLKEARSICEQAKKRLAAGIDPSAEKRARKMTASAEAENSFERIGREWIAVKLIDKSESHRFRSRRLLERDLFPFIGNRPISDINPPELLHVLRRIEDRGHIETAKRAKQTAGQVFRYAIATGRAERDPSADLRGALRTPKPAHFSAITTPSAAGQLMMAIDNFGGTMIVRTAMQLSALFFCRPGDLRHLEWNDINWDESRIEIPADRMKVHADHIIPLSTQAIDILNQIKPLTGRGRYIFPSARGNSRPMSENAVRTALRTMGYDNNTMTAHGFRAMARTMLDEVLGFPIEWIEQQLAHTVRDVNGRAYNRTKHLPQRREMMQRWADYLDELKDGLLPHQC